jgi:hypothetical protein
MMSKMFQEIQKELEERAVEDEEKGEPVEPGVHDVAAR